MSNTHNTPTRNDFIDIILSFKLWFLYTVTSIIAKHESIFLEMLHLVKFYRWMMAGYAGFYQVISNIMFDRSIGLWHGNQALHFLGRDLAF